MAIAATLTPTAVPSNTQLGAVPGTSFCHVTVTSASGAGTYRVAHGLTWTPTMCFVVPQLSEGTTPTASNASVAYCIADTGTTYLAFNLPGNGTFDVVYI